MEDTPKMTQGDHDLLIRLDTKMDRAATDIGALHKHITEVGAAVQAVSVSMDAKIAAAVASKVDQKEFTEKVKDDDKLHQDHENRIRRIEKYVWLAIGALTIIQIGIATLKV